MTKEEKIIKECLKLAEKGRGYVSPNPMVGCIIIRDGKIIGRGYHRKFGDNHAEINAISDAKKKGFDLKCASLYVNLEPCYHTGNTKPCVDEIIRNGFKRVCIGMTDPNPLVRNKSINKLSDNNIIVRSDILKEECRELNKFFIKYITKKLPYITLKIAQSIDGNIALLNGESKWITSDKSRKYVFNLRSCYDAILIGKNTAETDNPHLTTHSLYPFSPKRFVIDKSLRLNRNLNIFQDKYRNKTYVITSDNKRNKINANENIIYFKLKGGKIKLNDIVKYLYESNISSLLVEGGANLFSQFIEQNLFDEIIFIIASSIIGNGISPFNKFKISDLKKSRKLILKNSNQYGKDLILIYNNQNKK